MTLVRIYGPTELLDRSTDLLYGMGVLHVEALPPPLVSRVQVRDRRTEDREAVRERVEVEALYEKVRKCLILLPRPAAPARPLPPPTPAELHSAATAAEVDGLFRRVEELSGRRKQAADRIALLGKYEKMVGAILPLVERAGESAHLEMIGLTFGREHAGVVELLESELKRATDGLVQVFSTEVDERTVAALVIYGRSDAARVRSLLWDRSLNELKLPSDIEKLPLRDALAEIAGQAERLPAELRALDGELAALSGQWHPRLAALHAALGSRLQQIGTRSSFFKTRRSFVISGWLPSRSLERLCAALESAFAGRVVVEEVPVGREQERRVPIHLENPPLIRPFEVFVRLLPLPVYRTVDPTAYLAFFFPLFFGFIVGDLGYAVVIGALALLLRRRLAPGGMLRDLATVLAMSSAVAAVFGVAFGEFFGTLGEAFGMHPLHPGLNRLRSIPFFLGLSIAVGCLHVFLGLALGIWNAVRTRHRAGVWHRAGQAAALAGLILVVAAAAGAVNGSVMAPAVALLLGGLALWVAGEGFAAPIELLSTAGNVLSYARLMAVGLAGVVLAMVANELGRRSLWGILAAVVLHLVNLVLCIFSPTIHAMRLHLVEFFTKFYETGGAAYKPLRRQEER
jgi:V/A-type H+-transporting ATPase subunit I